MPFMVNLLFAPGLLDPLWSIGVEELFYLMWAPLVKLFHRFLPWVLGAVVLVKTALLTWAKLGGAPALAVGLIETLQFEAMAIGGLGAYWLYHRTAPIHQNRFFGKWAQVFFFGLILVKLVGYAPAADTSFNFVFDALLATPVASVLLVSGLFLWLILNISTNPQSFIKLENKPMRFLGEVSYGIYMYHLLVVSVVAMVLKGFLSGLSSMPAFLAWYALVGGGTIVVAWLSKRYFEDFFLRFK
jgi:peptidoglycan/LPS O-acetylase OafA/YrhL